MIDDSSVSLLLKNGTAVGSAQQIYCLSWNYHELDNPHSVQALHKMVRVKRPLFIFLIETFYLYKKIEVSFILLIVWATKVVLLYYGNLLRGLI